MYIRDESLYVSGLLNMASSVSETIGFSYVEADCFDDKNYIKDFSENYEIPEEYVELINFGGSFQDLLIALFGDEENIIEGLQHWISLRAGAPRRVFTVKEDNKLLEELSEGLGPFYYMENLFFVEFEKMVICFMIGNDE